MGKLYGCKDCLVLPTCKKHNIISRVCKKPYVQYTSTYNISNTFRDNEQECIYNNKCIYCENELIKVETKSYKMNKYKCSVCDYKANREIIPHLTEGYACKDCEKIKDCPRDFKRNSCSRYFNVGVGYWDLGQSEHVDNFKCYDCSNDFEVVYAYVENKSTIYVLSCNTCTNVILYEIRNRKSEKAKKLLNRYLIDSQTDKSKEFASKYSYENITNISYGHWVEKF